MNTWIETLELRERDDIETSLGLFCSKMWLWAAPVPSTVGTRPTTTVRQRNSDLNQKHPPCQVLVSKTCHLHTLSACSDGLCEIQCSRWYAS